MGNSKSTTVDKTNFLDVLNQATQEDRINRTKVIKSADQIALGQLCSTQTGIDLMNFNPMQLYDPTSNPCKKVAVIASAFGKRKSKVSKKRSKRRKSKKLPKRKSKKLPKRKSVKIKVNNETKKK